MQVVNYMELQFFGERLAQIRLAKGVSARDMSLSIGQSANYINKIENKKAFPSMTMFFYICDYLNISPQDFFDESNRRPEQAAVLIEDLKRLDEQELSHIAWLVKRLLCKS
ncbi:MAG: helix-turn-helix domain-containing protein [Oscillospiraceae bacterium]|nr:helix-turn-helix domain-containing protein [Oscillospiraceae bacterium]